MAGLPPPPGAHPGPPPPPPPPAPPAPGYGPPGYGAPPGWGAPPPGAPGYGAPPPGWGYVAPTHATRLGFSSAGFGERLGALVLDTVILGLISIPVWIIGIVFVASGWETKPDLCVDERGLEYVCDTPTGSTIVRLLLALFLGGIVLLVVTIFYWGKYEGERGQTPGKKALGIRVVKQETGQPIGFGRAIGRMFARYLSSQVLYLGYLWMLWDDNKQTWHDKIVGSIVVKE